MNPTPPILSIVILSMNNVIDLEKCLDSIYKYNSCELYEVFLVAYKFDPENLNHVKSKYDRLNIIESTGIRGFAENNNLALRKTRGAFTLVLNDDTFVTDSSIDKMLNFMINNPSIRLLSPHILNFDGTSQILGWPKYNIRNYIMHELKLGRFSYVGRKTERLFQTYSVSGACFMINTDLLKQVEFFDEKYYFTPEDIALSQKCILLGFPPFVWQDTKVYHKGSSTAKKIHQVTIPVAKQGIYLFFREFYGYPSEFLIRLFILFTSILKLLYWIPRQSNDRKKLMIAANLNCIKYSILNMDTKLLFTKLLAKTNK